MSDKDKTAKVDDLGRKTLQTILSEINIESLARSIGISIDLARASYIMDTVIADSFEEFSDTLLSFYIHLLQGIRRIRVPVDFNALAAEALALIERAFSNKGGLNAAIAEGRTGINGGMRFILDQMTDQFKREDIEKQINKTLKLTFDTRAANILATVSNSVSDFSTRIATFFKAIYLK